MRPARAKALIINAFALTGRIVIGGFLPQGVALGYVLLPLRGVLLRLLTHPPMCFLGFQPVLAYNNSRLYNSKSQA